MRQVPDNPTYLLIGGGRLARHLGFYLKTLGVSFIQWKRHDQSVSELTQLLKKQNTILLCIKDDQLEHFPPGNVWISSTYDLCGITI